jgi:hypothetical protein
MHTHNSIGRVFLRFQVARVAGMGNGRRGRAMAEQPANRANRSCFQHVFETSALFWVSLMRSLWLLALGACALGLVTGVRGHSADVACPAAVLKATSEAIGKMTTAYNISDIGVSLGQDHGGAVGVEEAVAVVRAGSDPAQRSRALQLLRYAFAKHAVLVFRAAGSISKVRTRPTTPCCG